MGACAGQAQRAVFRVVEHKTGDHTILCQAVVDLFHVVMVTDVHSLSCIWPKEYGIHVSPLYYIE